MVASASTAASSAFSSSQRSSVRRLVKGREVEEHGAGRLDRLLDRRRLVTGEVVHHDHVAGREFRHEHPVDTSPEGVSVDGAVEDHRSRNPAEAQTRDEGRGLPRPVRDAGSQAFGRQRAAVQPRHVFGCPGLVDEDEPLGVEVKLALEPLFPTPRDVRTVLLGGVGGPFFERQAGPVQEGPDHADGGRDASPAHEPRLHLGTGDVGLGRDQTRQVVPMRIEPRALRLALFAGTPLAFTSPAHPHDRGRHPDSEPLGRSSRRRAPDPADLGCTPAPSSPPPFHGRGSARLSSAQNPAPNRRALNVLWSPP